MRSAGIEEFLKAPGVLIDVRSPSEFRQGRIPGAHSIPLFDDAERAAVGTTYKQQGKEPAVEQGLGFVGPKLASFVKEAKHALQATSVRVHCWRGGMRSESMAWLFETAGLPALTLKGGYKAFRRWVLSTLQTPRRLIVIGGLTGCGKSSLLQQLKEKGEQVLDLEAIASHRGSSYGMLGMGEQPSNEQFENEIALVWGLSDPSRPLWVEDESRMIGRCKIPDALFNMMNSSPLLFLECPIEERVERLLSDYGSVPPEQLIAATERLNKKLGGSRTQEVVSRIRSGDIAGAILLTLSYYDATYEHGLKTRQRPLKRIVRPADLSELLAHT